MGPIQVLRVCFNCVCGIQLCQVYFAFSGYLQQIQCSSLTELSDTLFAFECKICSSVR